MKNEDPAGFRFRMTDEAPNSYIQEEMNDRRIKKTSRRAIWIAILIPTLIGIAAFGGYYDLKRNVDRLKNADVVEVQRISEELNSKFSSLSLQNAKLEESVTKMQESFSNLKTSFDKKVLPLDEVFIVFEKTASSMKKDLKNAQKIINDLKVSKTDKSDLNAALSKIEKQTAPFGQHLKNMESEIKSLDENMTQELAELSSALFKMKSEMKKYDKLQKDLAAVSTGKLDKKGLEQGLEDQEKRLQRELKKVERKLDEKDEKIKDMESQIKELMKFKALSEIKKRLQPVESPPSRQSPPPPPPAQPQATETVPQPASEQPAPPEPGAIIEQNLQP